MQDYRKYLEFYHPQTTIDSYISDITILLGYGQLTVQNIKECCTSRDLAPRSVNRYIASAKVYCKYLAEVNKPYDININSMRSPKIPKELPKYITPAEVDKIISTCTSIEMRAIIEILYSTGIRVSELLSISASDIKGNTLKVLGKGNKERIVYMEQITLHAIIAHMNSNRIVGNDLLFTWSREHVTRTIKKLGLKAGLETKVTAHVLRHSCFTQMIKNGANISNVAKLAGHSSIQTTQGYVHLNDSDVIDSFNQFSPRANGTIETIHSQFAIVSKEA